MSDKAHLFELLKDFKSAMLVTRDEKSEALRSRPMQVARVDEDGDFWFLAEENTNKVDEMKHEDHVLLTFQSEGRCYISVDGRVDLKQDSGKIEELWKDEFKTWFPQGKSQPNLIVIRVRTVDAEYWEYPDPSAQSANFAHVELAGV